MGLHAYSALHQLCIRVFLYVDTLRIYPFMGILRNSAVVSILNWEILEVE